MSHAATQTGAREPALALEGVTCLRQRLEAGPVPCLRGRWRGGAPRACGVVVLEDAGRTLHCFERLTRGPQGEAQGAGLLHTVDVCSAEIEPVKGDAAEWFVDMRMSKRDKLLLEFEHRADARALRKACADARAKAAGSAA